MLSKDLSKSPSTYLHYDVQFSRLFFVIPRFAINNDDIQSASMSVKRGSTVFQLLLFDPIFRKATFTFKELMKY